jgi:SAM-dependent methyltransferase
LTRPVAKSSRAICNYEGTSYRTDFWEGHGREYEDLAERIALRHMLPPRGRCLAEVGAGFGRLADLYGGYEQVVLLDYARSGLIEAQMRLGRSGRFLFVAADLYRLPLVSGTVDTLVTVRVLHHMIDIPAALRSVATALRPGGTYILEYANKRNLKSIARYILGRQRWSPFTEDPVEFVELNFDFHPQWMARELKGAGFRIEAGRAVSHFRMGALKKHVPPDALATADGLAQVPGAAWKLAPSVFLKCSLANQRPDVPQQPKSEPSSRLDGLLRCLVCDASAWQEQAGSLKCRHCGTAWDASDGIYDLRTPGQIPGSL